MKGLKRNSGVKLVLYGSIFCLLTTLACSPTRFGSGEGPSLTNADSGGDSQASLPPGSEQPVTACSENAGQQCQVKKTSIEPGCEKEDYVCASFWAVYYNSPKGCDQSAAQFVEYFFDGENTYNNFRNSNGLFELKHYLGGKTSPFRCTYVGSGGGDPLSQTKPDGSCFNATAAGYSIANTYTRVVLDVNCVHEKVESVAGKVQCDGSCK